MVGVAVITGFYGVNKSLTFIGPAHRQVRLDVNARSLAHSREYLSGLFTTISNNHILPISPVGSSSYSERERERVLERRTQLKTSLTNHFGISPIENTEFKNNLP